MAKKKPHSPRFLVWRAVLLITLGVTFLFGGAMLLLNYYYSVMETGSGCGPHYHYYQEGTLSSLLTIDDPQVSRNLTGANAITILTLTSEENIPVILTIHNSHDEVYLNITHPHTLTQEWRSFTLEIRSLNTYNDFLILTLQRTTNDTHITLYYETYYVDTVCIDYWPPYTAVGLTTIVGIVLIAIGFHALDKVGKEAVWQ
jgi:hypothetical protein